MRWWLAANRGKYVLASHGTSIRTIEIPWHVADGLDDLGVSFPTVEGKTAVDDCRSPWTAAMRAGSCPRMLTISMGELTSLTFNGSITDERS
jgi:hypothetical protein